MITIIISLIMLWDHITVRFAFPLSAENMTVFILCVRTEFIHRTKIEYNIPCLQCMCVMRLGYSSAVKSCV